MSKKAAAAVKKQELFPKVPPGYRLVTPEEELEIIKKGSVIQAANSTIARCDAEIRAANLEIQRAQQQFMSAQAGIKELHQKLGIEGAQNDILTMPDGKVCVLVDKAKREAHLRLLQGGKSQKAVKVSDGAPDTEQKKPQ